MSEYVDVDSILKELYKSIKLLDETPNESLNISKEYENHQILDKSESELKELAAKTKCTPNEAHERLRLIGVINGEIKNARDNPNSSFNISQVLDALKELPLTTHYQELVTENARALKGLFQVVKARLRVLVNRCSDHSEPILSEFGRRVHRYGKDVALMWKEKLGDRGVNDSVLVDETHGGESFERDCLFLAYDMERTEPGYTLYRPPPTSVVLFRSFANIYEDGGVQRRQRKRVRRVVDTGCITVQPGQVMEQTLTTEVRNLEDSKHLLYEATCQGSTNLDFWCVVLDIHPVTGMSATAANILILADLQKGGYVRLVPGTATPGHYLDHVSVACNPHEEPDRATEWATARPTYSCAVLLDTPLYRLKVQRFLDGVSSHQWSLILSNQGLHSF